MNREIIDLDLDVVSYSKKLEKALNKKGNIDECIIYIRTRDSNEEDNEFKTFAVVTGDPDMALSGMLSLFENVPDTYPLFLDAVQTYAEEHNIDIDNFWKEECNCNKK